ncbi:Vitamin K epoxide reductase [Streptomyces bungoensis]|uniref:Vitamin K epoxide reductase n=1 Tax=Streptomyces bungoensis TaxID=285568 RepID=A0A101TA77_9ACTN|nr:vitamin K epoxide reductase family protein [Streptomyces bungoensis]KUN88493.1 Vitamin K epoxide reductase [Streptomyces bungoensis]
MTEPRGGRPGRRTGLLLVLTGGAGWLASFQLTVDDWRLLKDPTYRPPCNISPVVSCGSVMASPEGSVFGFPNMVLGLAAFAAVAVLGLVVLTGGRLSRALWLGLNAGAAAGVVFVHWLIHASLFGLGRLCPYCVVVWAVTIALFWYVTLRNLRHGLIPVPAAGRRPLALVLETHGLLLAAWYGLIAVLVLTRFWPYWSSLL